MIQLEEKNAAAIKIFYQDEPQRFVIFFQPFLIFS